MLYPTELRGLTRIRLARDKLFENRLPTGCQTGCQTTSLDGLNTTNRNNAPLSKRLKTNHTNF